MDFQEDVMTLFSNIDKQWIQRRRLLDTATIFCDMIDSALTRKGLEFIIHTHQKNYSPAAICKARQHLPDDTFRKVNDELILRYANASRIFAIDGSKFYVPNSFKSIGFKSRTNDVEVPRKARRPIAMLSSLVDVKQDVCFDYCVSRHFNERQSALQHLSKLHRGDTVLFDRGYFSAQLYSEYTAKGVDIIFRLKCDAFKAVKAFVVSKHQDTIIKTVVRGRKLHIRLLKYYVNDKQYVIGTSLFRPAFQETDRQSLQEEVERGITLSKAQIQPPSQLHIHPQGEYMDTCSTSPCSCRHNINLIQRVHKV